MTHIHIPDGVLPFWLWGAGWLVAIALIALASRMSRREDVRRKVPLLGVVSALVLVSMSSEIVPIAYHINLTVVAGALLGPWLGIISAFVVEAILAMLGHGGVTVLGLNTLMIAAEMCLGWALFRLAVRVLGRVRVGLAAGTATVLTLAVTTGALVGIVALSGVGGATARETGALDPSSLTFRAPFSDGVFTVGLLGSEEEDGAGEGEPGSGVGGGEPRGEAGRGDLSVRRFASVVFTLGPVGWLVEALVTAGVLGYVARVRPTLVFSGALAETHRVLPGDEQGGH